MKKRVFKIIIIIMHYKIMHYEQEMSMVKNLIYILIHRKQVTAFVLTFPVF